MHNYLSDKSGPPTTVQVQYMHGISFAASLRGTSKSNMLQGISVRETPVTILKQSSKLMRSRGDHNICWGGRLYLSDKSGPEDCMYLFICMHFQSWGTDFWGTEFAVTVLSCKKWFPARSGSPTDFGKIQSPSTKPVLLQNSSVEVS